MECKDPNCFKHGQVKVRGNVFTGTVVSAKADKTVTIKRTIARFISKYERYKKSTSKIKCHAPECMGIKEGDTVRIGETRKLSKTKSFTAMEIIQKGEGAVQNESD
ncbi:MAG: 30S ribosomal protein S17 [Candidatus Micrarchaeota archaeon]